VSDTAGVRLILATFAVWRVTHLVVAEDGPWSVLTRLRRRAGVLLTCFNCTSVWVAAAASLVLGGDVAAHVLATAGLSGAAIVVERLTALGAPQATWFEEPPDESIDPTPPSLLRRDPDRVAEPVAGVAEPDAGVTGARVRAP